VQKPWAWFAPPLKGWWLHLGWLLGRAVLLVLPWPLAGHANTTAVSLVQLQRSVEPHAGLAIDYQLKVQLPKAVVDALQRGVPVHFVAQASLIRPRWYWRDERVARVTRQWRLAWQPLTSNWSVSQGGLSQTHAKLDEAVTSMARGTNWLVAEPSRIELDERYLVQFSWQIDTTQLPPHLKIGIGNAASEWALKLESSFGAIP
jgi:hypothetical protein